jgi:hypothetical protein
MSEAIPPILYDRPATLQKWPSLESRRLATGYTIHAQPVFEGTLAAHAEAAAGSSPSGGFCFSRLPQLAASFPFRLGNFNSIGRG